MHTFLLLEGLPEGIEHFFKSWDRAVALGHVMRVREVKLISITHKEEASDFVLSNLFMSDNLGNERKAKDGLGYVFKEKEAPFKHGRFALATKLLTTTMLNPLLGIKDVDWSKVDFTLPKIYHPTLVNIKIIGQCKDNKLYYRDEDRVDEYT